MGTEPENKFFIADSSEIIRTRAGDEDKLSRIYDRNFYTQYGQTNQLYRDTCSIISAEIARRFQPNSMVDWGCGAGLHAGALKNLGIAALGVDGSACPADLCAANIEIRLADLRAPLPDMLVPQHYDLSLCLDVMEHIDEDDSQQVLANITQGAKLLLLSCAPPGQGGHHHVNEQPRRYWVKRLAELGWQYQRRETGEMERSFIARRELRPMSWMYHNICVYRPT